MPTRKQTAANNKFLAKAKRIFNAQIYKIAKDLCNSAGEDAAREYLQQYVVQEIEQFMDEILEGQQD